MLLSGGGSRCSVCCSNVPMGAHVFACRACCYFMCADCFRRKEGAQPPGWRCDANRQFVTADQWHDCAGAEPGIAVPVLHPFGMAAPMQHHCTIPHYMMSPGVVPSDTVPKGMLPYGMDTDTFDSSATVGLRRPKERSMVISAHFGFLDLRGGMSGDFPGFFRDALCEALVVCVGRDAFPPQNINVEVHHIRDCNQRQELQRHLYGVSNADSYVGYLTIDISSLPWCATVAVAQDLYRRLWALFGRHVSTQAQRFGAAQLSFFDHFSFFPSVSVCQSLFPHSRLGLAGTTIPAELAYTRIYFSVDFPDAPSSDAQSMSSANVFHYRKIVRRIVVEIHTALSNCTWKCEFDVCNGGTYELSNGRIRAIIEIEAQLERKGFHKYWKDAIQPLLPGTFPQVATARQWTGTLSFKSAIHPGYQATPYVDDEVVSVHMNIIDQRNHVATNQSQFIDMLKEALDAMSNYIAPRTSDMGDISSNSLRLKYTFFCTGIHDSTDVRFNRQKAPSNRAYKVHFDLVQSNGHQCARFASKAQELVWLLNKKDIWRYCCDSGCYPNARRFFEDIVIETPPRTSITKRCVTTGGTASVASMPSRSFIATLGVYDRHDLFQEFTGECFLKLLSDVIRAATGSRAELSLMGSWSSKGEGRSYGLQVEVAYPTRMPSETKLGQVLRCILSLHSEVFRQRWAHLLFFQRYYIETSTLLSDCDAFHPAVGSLDQPIRIEAHVNVVALKFANGRSRSMGSCRDIARSFKKFLERAVNISRDQVDVTCIRLRRESRRSLHVQNSGAPTCLGQRMLLEELAPVLRQEERWSHVRGTEQEDSTRYTIEFAVSPHLEHVASLMPDVERVREDLEHTRSKLRKLHALAVHAELAATQQFLKDFAFDAGPAFRPLRPEELEEHFFPDSNPIGPSIFGFKPGAAMRGHVDVVDWRRDRRSRDKLILADLLLGALHQALPERTRRRIAFRQRGRRFRGCCLAEHGSGGCQGRRCCRCCPGGCCCSCNSPPRQDALLADNASSDGSLSSECSDGADGVDAAWSEECLFELVARGVTEKAGHVETVARRYVEHMPPSARAPHEWVKLERVKGYALDFEVREISTGSGQLRDWEHELHDEFRRASVDLLDRCGGQVGLQQLEPDLGVQIDSIGPLTSRQRLCNHPCTGGEELRAASLWPGRVRAEMLLVHQGPAALSDGLLRQIFSYAVANALGVPESQIRHCRYSAACAPGTTKVNFDVLTLSHAPALHECNSIKVKLRSMGRQCQQVSAPWMPAFGDFLPTAVTVVGAVALAAADSDSDDAGVATPSSNSALVDRGSSTSSHKPQVVQHPPAATLASSASDSLGRGGPPPFHKPQVVQHPPAASPSSKRTSMATW